MFRYGAVHKPYDYTRPGELMMINEVDRCMEENFITIIFINKHLDY